MAMFPDSGVPPSDAKNSLPDVITNNCMELWYSTSRCTPRFDPAAANAMLAEDMNLIMKGEVLYDCNRLDHIERATRYLIQRGLPRSAYMVGGPQTYTAALDPTLAYYNNYLTLTVVPQTTNIMHVTLNIDGKGPAPVLRNDGRPLEPQDLRAGIPYIIAFINGAFYMCGLAASQVPLIVKGGIDAWIRTDGNDITGDGSANTPEKAYRTINGCWNGVGSRFAATPMFSINMKFGIPGTYVGGYIGPFGGNVTLTGDINNPGLYRITCFKAHEDMWCSMWNQSLAAMTYYGVSFILDQGPPDHVSLIRIIESQCCFVECRAEILVNAGRSTAFDVPGGTFGQSVGVGSVGSFRLIGNNNQLGNIFGIGRGHGIGAWLSASLSVDWYFENIILNGPGFSLGELSTLAFDSRVRSRITNVQGWQYYVTENSIINMHGQPVPGTTPGTATEGGRFIA